MATIKHNFFYEYLKIADKSLSDYMSEELKLVKDNYRNPKDLNYFLKEEVGGYRDCDDDWFNQDYTNLDLEKMFLSDLARKYLYKIEQISWFYIRGERYLLDKKQKEIYAICNPSFFYAPSKMYITVYRLNKFGGIGASIFDEMINDINYVESENLQELIDILDNL